MNFENSWNFPCFLDDFNLTQLKKSLISGSFIFEERVFTAGNVYRKEFNTDTFMKQQS